MFYICDKYRGGFHASVYWTGGLAYTTRRLRKTSLIVTIAKYADTTTMHGTKSIVRKNITLDNIKYIVTRDSLKSIFETDKMCNFVINYVGVRCNAALRSDSYLLSCN